MIPAEARRIIDTLESVKHPKDTILDASECLLRMTSRSQRDDRRLTLVDEWFKKQETTNV